MIDYSICDKKFRLKMSFFNMNFLIFRVFKTFLKIYEFILNLF